MFQGPKGDIAQICKYTCSMETVQQNGPFTLFSSKFHSNIYSILFGFISAPNINQSTFGIDQMELYGPLV